LESKISMKIQSKIQIQTKIEIEGEVKVERLRSEDHRCAGSPF